MKKIKVLHIIHNLEIGGVETAVLSSLNNLNEAFEFKLVCIGYVNKELLRQVSPKFIKNIIIIHNFLSLVLLLKFIKRNKDYIFISSLWKSHFLHFLIKLIYPTKTSIIFIHNSRFAHFIDKISTLIGIRIADEVWADSDSSVTFITPYCSTIQPKIKINFLLNHSSPKNTFRASNHPFRFISLGRLSGIKRLDLSIKFIQDIRSNGIEASLDIYGPDNGILPEILDLISSSQLKNVIFYKGVCDVNQVETVLSQYDAFVLMSDYEGMSISTVQAMETGLLCFLRSVGEIANYGEDMVNSIILKSENPSDWQTFIKNSVHVLTNETLQKSIISNSTAKFANQLTYTQDVIQNLKRLSSQS